MNSFTYPKPVGFLLEAASEFYEGFTPGSGMAVAGAAKLRLAFRLDRSFEAVAVGLNDAGDEIVAEYTGTRDEATLRRQVARMLGLDADGAAWWKVGERDSVVRKLQADFPGFFTAAKPSPYDAAVWGIISPRIQMKQAAKLKMWIAEQHGDAVELNGRVHHVFPSPRNTVGRSATGALLVGGNGSLGSPRFAREFLLATIDEGVPIQQALAKGVRAFGVK